MRSHVGERHRRAAVASSRHARWIAKKKPRRVVPGLKEIFDVHDAGRSVGPLLQCNDPLIRRYAEFRRPLAGLISDVGWCKMPVMLLDHAGVGVAEIACDHH